MHSQLDSSRYARSILSNSTRRDVLWNVSEPGDPYDIKKSMIAKLPGDKKVFMGEHLELVCLLQAAEIQRLCQFLDQYKLKFREIERNNLDRHSYEVQIKELTEKVNGEESLKNENTKLREFSQRLQAQIEDLKRIISQQDGSFKNNYERTLERLNELLRENQEQRGLIETYRYEMSSFSAKYEALQTIKNKEIQELKINYSHFSRESYEAQINSIRVQYDSEIKRLEYELKRIKELNQTKNIEINDLQNKLKAALEDLQHFGGRQEYEQRLQNQIREFQNRFVIFGTEIQRLNISLREYINKYEESQRRRKELDSKGVKLQTLNQQLQDRLRLKESQISRLNERILQLQREVSRSGSSNQLIYEYQSKVSTLSREVEVLNSKLKYESDNSKKARQELERITYEITKYRLLQKENLSLKQVASQNNSLKKKLAELQNKNMVLSQELQRLQYTIKIKDSEIDKYRALSSETETLRSKISQLQYTYTSQSQIQISRIKVEYQHQIDSLKRSRGEEFQSQLKNYETELQRLRSTLKLKSDQSDKQRSRLSQVELILNRTDAEVSSKLKNYEFNLATLTRRNEELTNQLKLAAQNQRKLFEYQNKLTQYAREVQRLTLNLKNREEEVISIRTKYRELELVNQKYELDANKSKSTFEQNFYSLRQEYDALNRKFNDLVNESNRKLLQASGEIQRLGVALKNKNDEKNQLQAKLKQLTQENQYLKQNTQKLTAQIQTFRKRTSELQLKINTIFNENGATVKSLSQQNQSLKKQLNELKNQTNLFEFQANKKLTILEQNNANILRQNQELKRRLSQYQNKFILVTQEIERLGNQLRSKSQEYNALKNEYQKFKVAFKQYENDVNNHMELQVKRRFKELQLKIQELTKENEELKRKINENAAQFNKEFEKVTATLRQISQENENLKAELKKQINDRREQTILFETNIKQLSTQNQTIRRQFKEYEISVNKKLQGDIQRQLNNFQENIARLNQQNEQLRRRLQEGSNQSARKLAEGQKKYFTLTQEYEKIRNTANALGQENQAYKKRVQGYQVSIANYEGQVKRRFSVFEQNIASLNKENQELRRRLQEAGELNRKLIEYQSKITMISQEHERISSLLSTANAERENLRKQLNEKHVHITNFQLENSRKVNTYESNITNLQRENEELKRRLNEADARLKNYALQLQKLSNTYKIKVEEYSRLEVSIKKYESDVIKNASANEQNITALTQNNKELNRRVMECESKIALLSQELQRLTGNLKSKQEECLKLQALSRNQGNQLQSWRKKYSELQLNFNNRYEFEIKKKFSNYEQTISELNRRNTETQAKLNNSIQQIQRLNNILRLKVEQSTQQGVQYKNILAQFEDYKRKVRDIELNFSQNANSFKRENQDLRKRVLELEAYSTQLKQEAQRRIGEYQAKLKGLSQQYERQGQLLKSRNDQLQSLRKQFKEYEYSVSKKFEGQVKNNYLQYENRIGALTKEGDELKRRLQEAGDLNRKLVEYENKIVLLSQEMERLNVIISNKIEENQKLSAQNEELRRKVMEFNEVNRRIPEYEQKILLIIQQNQKLQYGLRNKTEELGALDLKYKQLYQENESLRKNIANTEQSWSAKFESEINRRTITYEQNMANLTREKEDLLRKKNEYESKIALLGQQLERVNSLLRGKGEEASRLAGELENTKKLVSQKLQTTQSEYVILEKKYVSVSQQYQNAKKHLQEYEQSIRKLYTEFERLQGIINELKKENQSLHTMNHNLSTEINRLSLENKDLEEQASEVRLRLSDQSALQKRINEHLALMVVLFAEIETLRKRVKEKEKEVAEVRRSSLAPNIL